MLLVIDIETLPGQSDHARAIARAETKAPGNIKKAESIEAWWAEHGEAAVDEQWRKQALDPALGELCAIGFAIGEDGEADSIVRGLDETENAFLRRALAAINAALRDAPHWHPAMSEAVYPVCHSSSFDFPFLRARCWANRIRPPHWMPGPNDRQGRDFGDTMTWFAGYGGRVSLSKLCACLGLADPKEQGDGRDVLALWKDGQHEALAAYNRADVEATRTAWLIMTGADCEVLA
ncbi:hypothetical protein GWK36_09035 [Caldichromatium japonicum]|uniref:Predicted 3'-5' exonuclease PolB-like domain-containing protein n=1 Tax=Caldichromatium japonicum TaxID=2699430 RepID=A0A6G7VE87_9GAMM|nr:hypothetical protein [Caldichromatium japonicum]QIK38107.1 hypothetical protein GWK36_09035 [Caldichromatium japonicum]